jgi:hypothetical protein
MLLFYNSNTLFATACNKNTILLQFIENHSFLQIVQLVITNPTLYFVL